MTDQKKHRNISVEQIAMLEQSGLVHQGYDKTRDKQVFHKPVLDSSTDDPKMLPREYYNQTKYDLVIKLYGPKRYKAGSLPSQYEFTEKPFPAGTHCYCPHGYYAVSHRDGTAFEGGLHTNVGDRMFQKETLLSRPEVTNRVFRKKH